MADAQVALDYLRANLGMGESPPGSNCNALTRWAGIGCVAWCAITVSRALNEAWSDPDRWQVPGVTADYSWGTAFVPNMRLYLIAAGIYNDTPVVGAVVIFVWGPGSPIGDHVGLCEAWVDQQGRARTDAFVADEWDGTVITLEGNADDDLVRKRRSMNVIDGFGHLPYDDEEFPMPLQDDVAWIKQTLEDIKSAKAELSEGDEDPSGDEWKDGLRKEVMIAKALDERSEAVPPKLDEIIARLDRLEAKVGAGGVVGGPVDADAVAELVASKLAKRLAE